MFSASQQEPKRIVKVSLNSALEKQSPILVRKMHEICFQYERITHYEHDEKGNMVYEIDPDDKVLARFLSSDMDCNYVSILSGNVHANCLYSRFETTDNHFGNYSAIRFCWDEMGGIWVKQIYNIPQAQKIEHKKMIIERKIVFCLSPIMGKGMRNGLVQFEVNFDKTARVYWDRNGLTLLSGSCDKGARYIVYPEGVPLTKLAFPLMHAFIFNPDESNHLVLYQEASQPAKKIIEIPVSHPPILRKWLPQRDFTEAVAYGRILNMQSLIAGDAQKVVVDYNQTVTGIHHPTIKTGILFYSDCPDWLKHSYTPIGKFQDFSLISFVSDQSGSIKEKVEGVLACKKIVPYQVKIFCFTKIEAFHSSASLFEVNLEDTVAGQYIPGEPYYFFPTTGTMQDNNIYIRYRAEDKTPLAHENYGAYSLRGTTIPNLMLAYPLVGLFAQHARLVNSEKRLLQFYPVLGFTISNEENNMGEENNIYEKALVNFNAPVTCNVSPFYIESGNYTLNAPYIQYRPDPNNQYWVFRFIEQADKTIICKKEKFTIAEIESFEYENEIARIAAIL